MKTRNKEGLEIGKLSGAGNDFILADARKGGLPLPEPELARRLCHRRLSVGADGLITLHASRKAHFRIDYYNSDGSTAALCLNGTRCAARFAFLKVIAPREMKIETGAGVYGAEIVPRGVRLSFPPFPVNARRVKVHSCPAWFVDVGVPHLIVVADSDVFQREGFLEEARSLRHHAAFAPAGTNVSFVSLLDPGIVAMRTYERGIEDEVLSCSSGSWAALHALALEGVDLPAEVQVATMGQIPLEFAFDREGTEIKRVRLTADARLIFLAGLEREAWEWGV
jgi:diaminopimelate epimerase